MALNVVCPEGHDYVSVDRYLNWPEGAPHCPVCFEKWSKRKERKMTAKEMLEIGKKQNFKTVKDCYEYVMVNYVDFFPDENGSEDIDNFEYDIDKYNLSLSDTIEEAFVKIGEDSSEWNEVEDSQNKNLLGC